MQKLNTSQTDFRAYEANFYIKRSKGFSKNLFIIIELLYSAFVILTTTVRKRRPGRLRQLNGWLRVRRPLYKFLQSPSYVQIIWRRLATNQLRAGRPAAAGPDAPQEHEKPEAKTVCPLVVRDAARAGPRAGSGGPICPGHAPPARAVPRRLGVQDPKPATYHNISAGLTRNRPIGDSP